MTANTGNVFMARVGRPQGDIFGRSIPTEEYKESNPGQQACRAAQELPFSQRIDSKHSFNRD
jgi:hypothetical protein